VNNVTSLRVTRETRNRLADLGSKDETFDEIIQRLIDFRENNGETARPFLRKGRGERSVDQ
jgi:hypothetical protein